MKILLVNKFHYIRGGAERAYFDTASILAERGHSVAFFAMDHPQNRSTEWSRFFVSGVEYADADGLSLLVKIRIAGRIFWNREAYRNMLAIIDEFHPDVAHLHNVYHQLSPSIIWALKMRRIPIVMTLHDYKIISPNYSLFVRGKIWDHASGWRCIMDRCAKDSLAKSLVCALEKWLHDMIGSYQLVDIFIAPSHFLVEKFHEFGWRPEIRVVTQPVISVGKKEGIGDIAPSGRHLFFGRLSKEKDIETILRAFALLPAEEHIDIVGDGPDLERLENISVELRLGDRVHFLGSKYGEDLNEMIARAKSVILSSAWYENMPYVLLESLLAGKIVIAARIGGIPERIRDGENGLLFEAGNAHALAEKIRSLENIDIVEMSDKARESVSDLSPEQYAESLEALYLGLSSKTIDKK
jgi:glycosyltransferase involved in cell wall biosynthesis